MQIKKLIKDVSKLLEIYHEVEIEKQPFKKGDTMKVYHGFHSIQDAIIASKYGLSGKLKANRVYSFEQNNNPNGLFVSPEIKVAKKFAGGNIQTVMFFDAKYEELEAPVWPDGSYTVQGGEVKSWGYGKEGTIKRRKAQKQAKENMIDWPPFDTPNHVRLSDNPHMADLLLNHPESQALFVGHLSPKRIKGWWVKDWKKNTESEFLSVQEFKERYVDVVDFDKEYHDGEYYGMEKSINEFKDKLFDPEDDFDFDFFILELQKKVYNNRKDLKQVETYIIDLWKHQTLKTTSPYAKDSFKKTFSKFLWPKQMFQMMNYFRKNFKK